MARAAHPTRTARSGHPQITTVSRGPHADLGALPEAKRVYCRNCGFICNLARDARVRDWELTGHTIVSSNELSNGSFEDWTAGSPDDWTVSLNGGTITQNTTDGFFDFRDGGISSAELLRSGSGSGISLTQSMATPSDFNNQIVSFSVRVKCSTNGVITIILAINGIDHQRGYNVSEQRFQELTVTEQSPTTVSSLTVSILSDSTVATAYIDSASLSRDGAPPDVSVSSGCPNCGSGFYNIATRD